MFNIIKELVSYSPFLICIFSFFNLFFYNWKKDGEKLILSYFMLSGSLFFLINLFKNNGLLEIFNILYIYYFALMSIACPLLYLYISSMTLFRSQNRYLIFHFIPAFILIYIGTPWYFSLEQSIRESFINEFPHLHVHATALASFAAFISAFKYIFIFQLIFYFLRVRIKMYKHKKLLNEIFSETSGMNLNWVKIFIWILAFWAIVAMIDYHFTINQQYSRVQLDFSIDLFLSFILGGVYIVASRHKSLPAFALVNHSGEEVPVFNPSNHAKLKEKLIYALEAKKLFLKKDLTINDLCAETGSNRTYISQLINSEFHMNFNTFVNKFRVEKAIEILNVEDNSLEEIASMSGFNSLASFNRAFKKSTGNYPGSMRKRSEKIA